MNSFHLPLPPGRLDLDLCFTSGQLFRWTKAPQGRWVGADGDTWASLWVEGDRLFAQGTATPEGLHRFFRLDWDAAALEAQILEKAPEMATSVQALRGLRVLRPIDPVETLVSFLCTPNNHLNRISGMVRALAEYGPELTEGVRCFPSLEVVANIPEAELRAKGFGYRGATIPRAVVAVLDRGGVGWLEGLKQIPYQAAHTALVALPGVGPKLADCIALFGLDHGEAVPVDTHVWQAAVRLYFPDWQNRSLTGARYEAIGNLFRERFGSVAGWAHQYLFMDQMRRSRHRPPLDA